MTRGSWSRTADLLQILHNQAVESDQDDDDGEFSEHKYAWDGTVYGMTGVTGFPSSQSADEKHSNTLFLAPSLTNESRHKLTKHRHLRTAETRPLHNWRNVMGEANSVRETAREPSKAKASLPLPPLLRTCHVFCFTAWNPRGRTRHMEDNLKASSLLKKDIAALTKGELNAPLWVGKKVKSDIVAAPPPKIPPPMSVWQGFDWNLEQGWRAEGFCLAYLKPFAEQGRAAVMALAAKYGQTSVVEYVPLPCEYQGDPGRLTRHVIPLDLRSNNTDDDVCDVTAVTDIRSKKWIYRDAGVTVQRVAPPAWPCS
mmetsp:Transcript_27539/g.56442  ORF Transcript_27539/g.56442 Transcript_27539/m.56442 type:complete len:312 (-) Transcript_27539:219-1154(-)